MSQQLKSNIDIEEDYIYEIFFKMSNLTGWNIMKYIAAVNICNNFIKIISVV